MKLKAVVAVVVLCLVGAFLYLRPTPSARASKANGANRSSGVVLTSEGDRVLVLYSGAEEVRRLPMHFPAGGLHEMRP